MSVSVARWAQAESSMQGPGSDSWVEAAMKVNEVNKSVKIYQ